MSVIVDVAEGVKSELNGHAFIQAFTAERHYQPVFDLPEMQTLHVSAVPRGISVQKLDRSRTQEDVQIDVGVQKKLETADNAEIDELMALVEEIADFFRFKRLAAMPGAIWIATENDPVFAREHLEQMRQFTSVLTLTFRVVR